MLRSNRGAARVSAVWMISVGVLALASLAFGFISQSDKTKVENSAMADKEARRQAEERATVAAEKKRNVSVVLGWIDPASADPESSLEAAKEKLDDLRAAFSDVTATDKTFEAVIPKVVDAYNNRGNEINTLKTRIQALEGEVASANNAVRQVTASKDQTIASLQQQLSDEQQNSATRQKELEDRNNALARQLSDRDAELRTAKATFASQERTWGEEKRLFDARLTNLSKDTGFLRGDFATKADGKVLDVSESTGIAWIDIGANQRVVRGMRFRVEGGLPGKRVLKCWAEVTQVDSNRSQISLGKLADPFDIVRPNDVVVNPIFDPTGGRKAVLAGSFSDYTRTELLSLLGKLNIEVQDEVDASTHFLITGGTVYNDPDTNEPLEEPIPVSDLAAYRNAQALRAQVMPIADVREFFRFD